MSEISRNQKRLLGLGDMLFFSIVLWALGLVLEVPAYGQGMRRSYSYQYVEFPGVHPQHPDVIRLLDPRGRAGGESAALAWETLDPPRRFRQVSRLALPFDLSGAMVELTDGHLLVSGFDTTRSEGHLVLVRRSLEPSPILVAIARASLGDIDACSMGLHRFDGHVYAFDYRSWRLVRFSFEAEAPVLPSAASIQEILSQGQIRSWSGDVWRLPFVVDTSDPRAGCIVARGGLRLRCAQDRTGAWTLTRAAQATPERAWLLHESREPRTDAIVVSGHAGAFVIRDEFSGEVAFRGELERQDTWQEFRLHPELRSSRTYHVEGTGALRSRTFLPMIRRGEALRSQDVWLSPGIMLLMPGSNRGLVSVYADVIYARTEAIPTMAEALVSIAFSSPSLPEPLVRVGELCTLIPTSSTLVRFPIRVARSAPQGSQPYGSADGAAKGRARLLVQLPLDPVAMDLQILAQISITDPSTGIVIQSEVFGREIVSR